MALSQKIAPSDPKREEKYKELIKELKRKRNRECQREFHQRQKDLKKNEEKKKEKKVPKANAERQREFRQRKAEQSYVDISKKPANIRKFCCISGCRNTNQKSSELIFFEVPTDDPEAKKSWLTIARREEQIKNRFARWYCCQQHFDLKTDVENYSEYETTGEYPRLKKDVVPHLALGSAEPSLPLPKRANLEEWDKFKRRLIRAVSRLLYKEKKPDDEVWAFLRKESGCDCLLLWDRMRSLTLKKLTRLLLANDRPAALPAVARMTLTDWLMCDIVLVHEDIDVIGRKPKVEQQPKPDQTEEESSKPAKKRDHPALIHLFSIVQMFRVETMEGESLALAWSAAAKAYNTEGRQCSPMLLQRRWYQLKEWTRLAFYEFWQSYRGNKAKFEKTKHNMPGNLQCAIARRFPHVITADFYDWEKLISWEQVVMPEHFEALTNRKLPAPCDDDPDLEILEDEIETIDVDSDDDSNDKEKAIDDPSHFEEHDETNNMQDYVFDPSIVKTEPIDNIDIEEHEVDKNALILDSASKALEEIDQALAESNVCKLKTEPNAVNDLEDNDVEIVSSNHEEQQDDEAVEANEVVANFVEDEFRNQVQSDIAADVSTMENHAQDNIQQIDNNIEDFDETAQSGFDTQLPMITNVLGNVTEKELSNLSAISTVRSPQAEMVAQVDEDEDDEEDTMHDIIKIKVDEYLSKNVDQKHEMTAEITESKDEEKVEDSLRAVQSVSDIVIDDFDESSAGVSFADDGIAYTENDDVQVGNEDIKTESEEATSFDLKLLMEPVVYTTKLDQMTFLKDKVLGSIVVGSNIENILNESKPISKRSISNMQLKQETKSDIKVLKIKFENHEEDNDNCSDDDSQGECLSKEDTDMMNAPRVKLTSSLLQKPKNCTYGPFQICKNPDFNTRLKRINMGFYNYERNIQLLKLCIPVTVDLHKAFESKLCRNTLRLEKCDGIKLEKSENKRVEPPRRDCMEGGIAPTAPPAPCLMSVPPLDPAYIVSPPPEPTPEVCAPRIVPRPCILPPSFPPTLPPMLPPLVPPPPPPPSASSNNFLHVRNKPGPAPSPFSKCNMRRQVLTKEKKSRTQPLPSWLTKRKGDQDKKSKFDDFLLTPDTLTKMLMIMCTENAQDDHFRYKNFSKKKKKFDSLLYPSDSSKTLQVRSSKVLDDDTNVCAGKSAPRRKRGMNEEMLPKLKATPVTKIVDSDESDLLESKSEQCKNNLQSHTNSEAGSETISIPDLNDVETLDVDTEETETKNKSDEKKAVETPTDDVISLDDDDLNPNDNKQKNDEIRIARRSYCCWAQRKIANIGKRTYIKHKCPLDKCKCCCMQQFQDKMREYKHELRKEFEKRMKRNLAERPTTEPVSEVTALPSDDSEFSTYKKPVAHIKIVSKFVNIDEDENKIKNNAIKTNKRPTLTINPLPMSSFNKRPFEEISSVNKSILDENLEQKKSQPSVLIDRTSKSKLIAEGATQSPIYLGKNKVLLTSLKFPPYLQDKPQDPTTNAISPQIFPQTPLPPGVQLVLLPNGNITCTVDPNIQLTPEQTAMIPTILALVQQQLNAQSTPEATLNTSDEIVISDDEEPDKLNNVTQSNTLSTQSSSESENVVESLQPEENGTVAKTNISTDNVSSSRKSLLSDLMEMSGISLEDTLPLSKTDSSSTLATQDEANNALLPTELPSEPIPTETNKDIASEAIPLKESNEIDSVKNCLEVTNDTDNVGAHAVQDNVEIIKDAVPISADDIAPGNDVTNEILIESTSVPSQTNSVTVDGIQLYKNTPPATEENSIVTPTATSEQDVQIRNASEFSAVTSFAKLKYVVENNGKFFKLDLESGLITPINVCLKKKGDFNRLGPSIKRSRDILDTRVFKQLHDRKTSKLAIKNDGIKRIVLKSPHNIQKTFESTEPRPVKLISAIRPSILKKANLLNKIKPEDIVVIKQKRKQRLMARITAFNSNSPKPPEIEIIDSDDDMATTSNSSKLFRVSDTNDSEDSSDDEPLSKVAKRIRYPETDATPNAETYDSSKVICDENEPRDAENNIEPAMEGNRSPVEPATPMDVDPEIDLPQQSAEESDTVLSSEQLFNPSYIGQFPNYDEGNSDSGSNSDEGCILGV